jgi:serine/threonine-protein kinase RsbW
MAKRELKMTIPSDFTAARKAHKEILEAVVENGFKGHAIFAIKLSVEEVLMNAVKHGNRLDASKQVYIEAAVTPEKFEITVEDEGAGFNPANVPDPRCEENLEKVDGRGLLLIRSYMDDVEYTHGGRKVRMVKKNRDNPPRPPPC